MEYGQRPYQPEDKEYASILYLLDITGNLHVKNLRITQ